MLSVSSTHSSLKLTSFEGDNGEDISAYPRRLVAVLTSIFCIFHDSATKMYSFSRRRTSLAPSTLHLWIGMPLDWSLRAIIAPQVLPFPRFIHPADCNDSLWLGRT